MRMSGFIAKYGKIALALAAIFLSGQVIGWMLALHSCEARQPVTTDTERWSDQMMARLQDDLDLTPGQAPEVRAQLEAVSSRMKQKRDSALFQIYLELVKLHDDMAPGMTPEQKIKLASSRKKLIESINSKFPDLLRATAVPPEATQPAPTNTP
jgi:hypothetical protein